ncbi:MBL fold metallo-hydrolase [Ktedonospora formicarum]|uniref:MBL fold metallo-hydrolase n=1 Tax=Ktedonospora formicarum TaxID=2778364 RepID=A0A8J3HU35_9CHLR|nr:MBL fold metallo-hydrolase [Ktedonospora formicarum]GHO43754.1 MBL fold metallo-hydrolase [Ktedonospora formicarum]
MRVVSLASGSSGNALFVEAGPQGRTKILVDAGLGVRVLRERLQLIGVSLEQLSGVLITHEHSDHVLALPSLIRRYRLPIFTNAETFAAVEEGLATGAWRSDSGKLVNSPADVELGITHLIESEVALLEEQGGVQVTAHVKEAASVNHPPDGLPAHFLTSGKIHVLGDIEITSFPTSHDAVSPSGYLLNAGGCRICVVTDTGEVTPEMLTMMHKADLLVLESNHDRQRLLRGPYPYKLKQRIFGPTGHLSNDQAAQAVLQTWHPNGVRWLWLAHLSRTNNTPTLALTSMRERLQHAGANLSQVHISVLPPGMGGTWDSTQLWHAPSLWDLQP